MNTPLTSTPPEQPKPNGWFARFWVQITEPALEVTNLVDRQRAQLLSALMVVLVAAVVVISLIITTAAIPFVGGIFVSLASLVFMMIIYTISRSRYFNAAGIILSVGLLVTGIISPTIANRITVTQPIPDLISVLLTMQFIGMSFLLITMILPEKLARRLIFIALAAILVLPYLRVHTSTSSHNFLVAFMALVVIGGLLIVFTNHRNDVERLRQAELRAALSKAEEGYAALVRANQELAKATELAQESARLKSEFVSNMSHELRTPLNAINGFCGIILTGMGGEVDAEAGRMLKRIEMNSARLLDLVNDVLDIAKIESGRLDMAIESFDLRDLVSQWEQQMGILAQKKQIGFRTSVGEALPKKLEGDPVRITQIAINLLSNAFKFTQQGEVCLEVREKTEGPTKYWQIVVSDTGIGIPLAAQSYIFEKFRQVDGSSRRAYGGTGLGLAISQSLTQTMGGTLTLQSQEGAGSTFTVTLPQTPVPLLVPAHTP
jgi:signal transduction histidine kinase